MIERSAIFDLGPANSKWIVRTDETYEVDPNDRFVTLLEDVDIYLSRAKKHSDFYCWVVSKDGTLTGVWVENDEIQKFIGKSIGDPNSITPEVASSWAQKKPSLSAPFLTPDALKEAFDKVKNKKILQPSTIYMSPKDQANWITISDASTGTSTYTGNITINTSNNLPDDGNMYIINQGRMQGKAFYNDVMNSWKITTS